MGLYPSAALELRQGRETHGVVTVATPSKAHMAVTQCGCFESLSGYRYVCIYCVSALSC
jgi:hypothetical protein